MNKNSALNLKQILSQLNISVKNEDGSYKSLYEVLNQLALAWNLVEKEEVES